MHQDSKAISDVIAHLQDRFPRLPAEAIAEEARHAFEEYDGARVRAFLPILVEREAGERLRQLTVA